MANREPEGNREGGDPPCWAHLFGDASEPDEARHERGAGTGTSPAGTPGGEVGVVADLVQLAPSASGSGAVWRHQGNDLSMNLLALTAGDDVAEHVNAEVDVLLVGIAGERVVEVDGVPQVLGVGHALVIPKGSCRAIQGTGDHFAYLACHRRRGGLWPSSRSRAALVDPNPGPLCHQNATDH